jgi:hypothetical protein
MKPEFASPVITLEIFHNKYVTIVNDGGNNMSLTYDADVAPHLDRALFYRAKRNARWNLLHRHDGRARIWAIALLGLSAFWGAVAFAMARAAG